MNLQRVSAVQDDSCHWFIIPYELEKAFYEDLQNGEMLDSGEFEKKYGKYMTGGSINDIGLYADIVE